MQQGYGSEPEGAHRADTGNTGDECDGTANQADDGQDKACGPQSAIEAGLLRISGTEHADQTGDNGQNGGVAEKPQNNSQNTEN